MLSTEELGATIKVVKTYGIKVAADQLGLTISGTRARITLACQLNHISEEEAGELRKRKAGKVLVEIDQPPPTTREPEELIAERKKIWERKHAHHEALKLIDVNVPDHLPIGIAHIGDPHLDDDGCNLPLLESHIKAIADTDGLYAGCVGDLQNGWPGRLAILYAEQTTTAQEAWTLIDWMIQELEEKLLYIISGNHDVWTTNVNGLNVIDWIKSQAGLDFISEPDGVRLAIHHKGFTKRFGRPITINGRHDFAGKSRYSTVHGLAVAAMLGFRDDILIAGHTHASGYQPVKDPSSGKVSHLIRTGSYKWIDSYARGKGLPDQNIFECPVTIIDPGAPDPRHAIRVHFDCLEAAEYLGWLRDKRAS